MWEIIGKMGCRLGNKLRPSGGGVIKLRSEWRWVAVTLKSGERTFQAERGAWRVMEVEKGSFSRK